MSKRITKQRSEILRVVVTRAEQGLETTAADVTRIVWGGLGHSATYAVISRMKRSGLLRAERRGPRVLLAIA